MVENKQIDINLGSKEKSKSYSSTRKQSDFLAGIRTEKDMIAPGYIEVVDDKTLKIDGKYVRNFVMQGYPSQTQIGWLENLYGHRGDIDIMVKFEPMDSREAVDKLTKEIANYMSQLEIETEKGSVKNISKYRDRILKLEEQRTMIERNLSNLLQGTIYANLMADSLEELNSESEKLINRIKGQRMDLVPTYSRITEGFKACLPCLPEGIKDKKRNFNSGGALSSFHLYDSELSHRNGILLGNNYMNGSPVYVDFIGNGEKVRNNNMTIVGTAGSGKSYFTSLFIMRSSIKGVLTTIIDPEGEYHNITNALGGITVKIGNAIDNINMFDVDEEEKVDDDGHYLDVKFVNLKEKISDLLGIIGVMAQGITKEQEAIISFTLQELYSRFGITEDYTSLYEEQKYDPLSKMYHNASGVKKRMPQFSDFYDLLEEVSETYPVIKPLFTQLRIYKKGGIFDMFDCQSSVNFGDLRKIPVINFDISALESAGGETLRPLGIYIALTFTLDKFVKKLKGVQKRVVVDEAWMMLNKNMPGHQFTAKFLENLARRIRKRHASLCVATQNFSEFMSSSEGEAVIKNSPFKIFLKQSEIDLEMLQDVFKLSDGEREFVSTANTGEILLKMDELGSTIIKVSSFPFEHEIITRHTKK